jgi:hypothetical protein
MAIEHHEHKVHNILYYMCFPCVGPFLRFSDPLTRQPVPLYVLSPLFCFDLRSKQPSRILMATRNSNGVLGAVEGRSRCTVQPRTVVCISRLSLLLDEILIDTARSGTNLFDMMPLPELSFVHSPRRLDFPIAWTWPLSCTFRSGHHPHCVIKAISARSPSVKKVSPAGAGARPRGSNARGWNKRALRLVQMLAVFRISAPRPLHSLICGIS